VIDYISTPWMMPAIYNVADIFIVTMMISVALLVLVGLRFDGTRERRSTAAAPAQDASAIGNATPAGTGELRDPLFPTADPDAGAPPATGDGRRES
jgi:signal peptidase II